MKLIVEVVGRDDKVTLYECVDFPYFGSPFVTLYLKDFERHHLHIDAIAVVRQHFKP